MQDNQDVSSKTIQSDSFRVATSRVSSIENTESSTSKSLNECILEPTVPTIEESSSIAYTRTDKTSVVSPFSMTVTRNGLFKFFHIENLVNASDEEIMFLAQLHFKMRANAKILAHEADGKCDRAYQAILSAMISMTEGVNLSHETEDPSTDLEGRSEFDESCTKSA